MENLAHEFQKIKLTVIYILLLVAITYGTSVLLTYTQPTDIEVNLIKLFTAPFNSYFEGNYQSNIGITAIILLVAEFYMKSRKHEKLITKIFQSGVLATYLASFIDFWGGFDAGAGSSILAFSVFVCVLLFFIVDILFFAIKAHVKMRLHKNMFTRRQRLSIYAVLILLILLIIPIVWAGTTLYYSMYIANSNGFSLFNPHLLGLLLFVPIFLFISLYKIRPTKAK